MRLRNKIVRGWGGDRLIALKQKFAGILRASRAMNRLRKRQVQFGKCQVERGRRTVGLNFYNKGCGIGWSRQYRRKPDEKRTRNDNSILPTKLDSHPDTALPAVEPPHTRFEYCDHSAAVP